MRLGPSSLLLTVVAGLAAACSSEDLTTQEVFSCPSRAAFVGESPDGGVDPALSSPSVFMARRCGTMDCHGAAARPMRLYGQLGLRHPTEDNFSGGAGTTQAEHQANYDAVCSVEPEAMSQAATDFGSNADTLLIVRKARAVEHHKGGVVVEEGDPADQCIVRWVQGESSEKLEPYCSEAIHRLE